MSFSGLSACPGGNCRVNYLMFFENTLNFNYVEWIDTTGTTTRKTNSDSGLLDPAENNKILIPEDIFLTRIKIDFGTSQSICEIIVAGTRSDTYKCSAGRFFDPDSVQCKECPVGKISTKGSTECSLCLKNTIASVAGSTECTPCNYLEYSSDDRSYCRSCSSGGQGNLACYENKGYVDNVVSTDVGDVNVRSRDISSPGTLLIRPKGPWSIVLSNSDNFFVGSIVLIFSDGEVYPERVASDTTSCVKSSKSGYQRNTLVITCQQLQQASSSVAFTISDTISLKKLFVLGGIFGEAATPEGYYNTGTQFSECSPGSYSRGGKGVTSCQPCLENQFQDQSGQTRCDGCPEGKYSREEAAECSVCTSISDSNACQDLSNACEQIDENNPIYGSHTYNWPIAFKDDVMELACEYNNEKKATKKCEVTNEKFKYGATDFSECKTRVTDEIDKIEEETVNNTEDQASMSQQIMEIAAENSNVMNTDNVEKTSSIIDEVLDFEHDQDLPDDVKDNVLKTIDSVHQSTEAEELHNGHAASKMRESVKKLSDRMSVSDKSEYITEPSIGVAVVEPTTASSDTVFSIVGDQEDFLKTKTVSSEEEEDTTDPVIFSVKVPADTSNRPVTAIIYKTTKFYPDNVTVINVDSLFAGQFTGTASKNTDVTKIVSMVTDINYSNNDQRINFDNDKSIELKYSIKDSSPNVYYKMHVTSQHECVYYDTANSEWVRGHQSGCKTKVEIKQDGQNVITCECDHMTSFAVLMSFGSDYDPMEEIISQILLAISLGCLFCTIVAYLPAKDLLKTRTVRLNLLLVTSIIFAIIIFYFMEVVVSTNIKDGKTPSETDTPSVQCIAVAFLMNYLWLCQMGWMVCEAVVMYRALVSCVVNSHIHRYMLKFNLACWGIPLIFPIIGVSWGKTDFVNPKTCFLRKKYGYVTFYAPVLLCIAFNIFIFIRVAWSIGRNQNMGTKVPVSDMERRKKQFKFAVTVMSLLGVAWIFGFFLILEETNTIWLRYLFIIFNSTQGIFIFILYVVCNDNLKKIWKKLLGISGHDDKRSHTSLPYSKSKGSTTKQTNVSNTRSMSGGMISMTTTRSNPVTVVELPPGSGGRGAPAGGDTSGRGAANKPASPRSTQVTTSLASENVYSNDEHIYDNAADPVDSITKPHVGGGGQSPSLNHRRGSNC